jgi:putative protein-disulfide isomerase
MKKKLIYIMDPQCGWCYGNGNNMLELHKAFHDKFDFEVLNGGMWIGPNAPKAGKEISNYIIPQLPRLTSLTGVTFSDSFKTLIQDSDYTLSSLEPCAAHLIFKEIHPDKALVTAKDIQSLLFVEGKPLNVLDSYLPLLEKYHISLETFAQQWLSEENITKLADEFKRSSSLAKGYPTFILDDGKEQYSLANGYFELEPMKKLLHKIFIA